VFLLYVDDGILCSPDNSAIEKVIKQLQKDFEMTDEGTLSEYLGIRIDKHHNGGMLLTQPTLIKRIIEAVGIDPTDTKQRIFEIPSVTPLLQKDLGGLLAKNTFNFRSVIGMLNFLTRSTRPDISFAVHQCARFMSNPRLCHEKAVIRIARYLLGTQQKGIIMTPDDNESLVCFADADFAGGYHKGHTEDSSTAKSRTGYVITYAGCPLLWNSKLQTEVATSTTEAEYIALSQALREVIPIMSLLNEIRIRLTKSPSSKPMIRCKAFEDNAGALELANAPKMRPRTKHINIKYHHFREHVAQKLISIHKIGTQDQIADVFTKPLKRKLFQSLRKRLQGW
jgi:Reverse transcriptase (RNA-dependent DNA polymerase)